MIPRGTIVHRTLALDVKKHMGIRGKYPSILAQPDRWVSWWPTAVLAGLRLIKRHRVHAIWSTYPIMTAHSIAYTLSRASALPWIADFRDPVASSVSGNGKATVASQIRWEQRTLSRAARSVFTTPSAAQACVEHYPAAFHEGRIHYIPNGFDEADFVGLETQIPPHKDGPLHFVHAGVLYPEGRNPAHFFRALASLKRRGILKAGEVRITLRASGWVNDYGAELKRLGIGDIVTLAPRRPYREVLVEQASADGLLLFQGERYDRQIPAKLYEYLRLRRPIFGLVGEHGDAAGLLREMPSSVIAPIDSESVIEERFAAFMDFATRHDKALPEFPDVQQYSRDNATGTLARLLDSISACTVPKQ
jgi:glycosyltransferase involved in cell wall biosynthesis